jgi:lipid-A-disaccharide synthase
MEKAGVEILVDQRHLAVSGIVELLPDLHRVVASWRRMVRALRSSNPDLVVLVDSSGFNIPFARRARRRGVPTLYYVSPQVWVWRTGRIRKLARWVNRLAVIFPFEREVYAHTELPVDFVGHPMVDRLLETGRKFDRASARQALGLDPDARLVALMPGSRRGEMRHLLPLHLEVARALHARDPRIHFVFARSPSIDAAQVDAVVAEQNLPSLMRFDVVEGRSHEVLCAADLTLAKPGTVTLESALLGTPLVVAARSSWFTAFVLRRTVQVDSLTMPNLLAGAPIVPELLQEDAQPERVADEIQKLLKEGPERETQRRAFDGVREQLGAGGAAGRAARIAAEMLASQHGTPASSGQAGNVGRLPA